MSSRVAYSSLFNIAPLLMAVRSLVLQFTGLAMDEALTRCALDVSLRHRAHAA